MQEIVIKKVKDLKPYEKNPRRNDEAVKAVMASIKEFGFKVPIVIDKNDVIVCGHTRYKAVKKLKFDTVPCIIADDLSDEQIKAFRLADNKVSEKAEWDFDLLSSELDDLFDFDMTVFGFDASEDEADKSEDNTYTSKTDIPQYEPTGKTVTFADMINEDKVNKLISEIEASDISDDEKSFLIKAAQRHLEVN